MNTISINKYLVMYILIFLLGWASRTRPGYRRQRICNDGHGMGSFSHAFVPLPTILPTGGYQKWPRGKPQGWGPHEWPRSSRGHVRKTELLLSVIKRKKKNNKPTKKKILGGPLMYRLKNNNKTTKKDMLFVYKLHTMYIYLPVDTTLEEKPQKFYHAFEED